MMLVFIVVGKNDRPLYELELSGDGRVANTAAASPSSNSSSSSSAMSLPETLSLSPFPRTLPDKKDENHLSHFIIHSSLDIVDEAVWRNKDMYAARIPRLSHR